MVTAMVQPEYLAQPKGRALIQRAIEEQNETAHTLHYLQQHTTQASQSSCALASASVVLNALSHKAALPAPFDPGYNTSFFTPSNVLSKGCSAHVSPVDLASKGRTLEQAAEMLRCHVYSVSVNHAGESDESAFMLDLQRAFNTSDARAPAVIANFDRKPLYYAEQVGHFSPIAAAVNDTDAEDSAERVLVLDVSRYKREPHWPTASELFDAMNTTDGTAQKSRGWLLVYPPPEDSSMQAVQMERGNPSRKQIMQCLAHEAHPWRWPQVEECCQFGNIAGSSAAANPNNVTVGGVVAAAIVSFIGGAAVAAMLSWFARRRYDSGYAAIPGLGQLRYRRFLFGTS